MSDPSASTFHETTGGNVEGSELITSGHDTTVHKSYYNLNIGVFPDVISYVRTASQHFVALVRTNQSGGESSKEHDIVEINNIIPPDPSSLPALSIADRYTRCMLECMVGYPLYEPHPFSQHSEEYSRIGVNVGDVGFVREDGAFDFLFNICPSKNSSINPPNLPNGFSLEVSTHLETRMLRSLAPKTCFVSGNITVTESSEFVCDGSEGAVLELPGGAMQYEAINRRLLAYFAKLHGLKWYKYTIAQGRDISNGSLYLVTSFTKCTEWGIAVFNRRCQAGQGLTFSSSPLGWKGSRIFPTMVADPEQHQGHPNQCVFIRGYKIMIRQDIFDNLCHDQSREPDRGMVEILQASPSPEAGSGRPIRMTRQRATRIRGGGGSDFTLTDENPPTQTTPTMKESDKVVLQDNFNSSPIHPSDLINATLLCRYPDARVALTHDEVWCDILGDKFPVLNYGALGDIAGLYMSTIDENGCISLEKSMSADPQIHERISTPATLEKRMSADPQIHKRISTRAALEQTGIVRRVEGIPPEYLFPVWNQTLDYEFSEDFQGIQELINDGYQYRTMRREYAAPIVKAVPLFTGVGHSDRESHSPGPIITIYPPEPDISSMDTLLHTTTSQVDNHPDNPTICDPSHLPITSNESFLENPFDQESVSMEIMDHFYDGGLAEPSQSSPSDVA